MITKVRLLAGLNEMLYVEEGLMGMFASFTKALVQHTEGMEETEKKGIEKMLSVLQRDSARHKQMIEELIKDIESGGKYEY